MIISFTNSYYDIIVHNEKDGIITKWTETGVCREPKILHVYKLNQLYSKDFGNREIYEFTTKKIVVLEKQGGKISKWCEIYKYKYHGHSVCFDEGKKK